MEATPRSRNLEGKVFLMDLQPTIGVQDQRNKTKKADDIHPTTK